MHSTITRSAAAAFAVAAVLATAAPVNADESDVQRIASANLRGENEVPGPGDPNGKGQFAAVITTTQLCYSLSARRIKPATGAHIHLGDPTVAGPITVTLLLPNPDGVGECITAVADDDDTDLTLSESELAGLRDNREAYYVNVHNVPFPGGAIRGQLS